MVIKYFVFQPDGPNARARMEKMAQIINVNYKLVVNAKGRQCIMLKNVTLDEICSFGYALGEDLAR